jgi:HK97 family phage prohead protease
MNEILIRSYALERAVTSEGDGRTLSIRAVPWDTEAVIGPDTVEVFDPGAFDKQIRAARHIKLTLGHPRPGDLLTNSLIGSVSALESRKDGLHVQARMASSSTATEALALVNDGVLDQVSIGFVNHGTEVRKLDNGGTVLRRMVAHLDHLALVDAGAYGEGAKVLAVREEPTGPTLADLRALAARLG